MPMRICAGVILVLALAGCKLSPGKPDGELKRFANAAELQAYIERVGSQTSEGDVPAEAADATASAPADAAASAAPGITGSPQSEPPPGIAPGGSITNNQVSGVDEGGIVKNLGRFLITLKEGRLFVADTGLRVGDPLRLVDRMNVYTAASEAADWYDEMLVSGDRILVTAYSYRAGGSEISVFRIDGDGRLTRDGRYVLESYDYFSSENYATRLVDGKLVFYAPYPLYAMREGGVKKWPRLRRAGDESSATPLFRPQDIVYGPDPVFAPVLHLVSTCTLEGALECTATGVMGSGAREMYVSRDAVYLWSEAGSLEPAAAEQTGGGVVSCQDGSILSPDSDRGVVVRIPLGNGEPGMVYMRGAPHDQFAFSERKDTLHLLVQTSAASCDEFKRRWGTSALANIPLSQFDGALTTLAPDRYTTLPQMREAPHKSRYTDDWLLAASDVPVAGTSNGRPQGNMPRRTDLVMVPLDDQGGARMVQVDHSVTRMDRIGNRFLLVGQQSSDHMEISLIDPAQRARWIAARTLVKGRTESESRSHGFSARPEADGSALFGFATIASAGQSYGPYARESAADLSWFHLRSTGALSGAGFMAVQGKAPRRGYHCEVSCIDWYGEVRPIFLNGRIFGLLGTELVEGLFTNGTVNSGARIDLTAPVAKGT